MRFLVWALRAFLFFTLFAFALNNEQPVTVHWFFGYQWRAPLVIVVLAVLTAGAALGVLAMVPSWWRHRSVARRHAPPDGTAAAAAPGGAGAANGPLADASASAFPAPTAAQAAAHSAAHSTFGGDQPPRLGL